MSRNAMAIVASLLFAVLAVSLVVIPVPYVSRRPGLTIDVLASAEKGPVIEITDVPTFETTGKLLMTTVTTTRVDATIGLPEAIIRYLDSDSEAMPRDVIYPPGKTVDQIQDDAVRSMGDSRVDATVAALRAASLQVEDLPRVAAVSLSGPSADKLLPDDLILTVNDQPVTSRNAVRDLIEMHAVGDTVVLNVLRDGAETSVAIVLGQSTTEPRRPVLGVELVPGFRFTPQVTFGVDQGVTGPSAGLVFALGIYDRITEGDLVGGDVIAGTGTIDPEGVVGPIGGIREKVKGAERDGATIFLLPERNCLDVEGVETSLTLVSVNTLRDAISALQHINEGNTAEVPTCG